MKKILAILLLAYPFLIYAQGTDNSSNAAYSDGWATGDNGGTGFGSWTFSNTGNAGQFRASSASQSFGNIDVSGTSFGMYGNTTGTDYSNSSRDFSTTLADGNTFKISLAIAYRNGNKGINLYEGATQRFNFNVGSDLYTAQGSDLGWTYSQTSIIILEVTQVNSTTIAARLTRGSDIYNSGNISTTGRLTGFKLYCGNTQSGDLNNLFANSLEIRTDSPLPVELTSFTSLINNANVLLNWQTATEVNNYGFEVERNSVFPSGVEGWERIAFVQGHGNSNSPKSYLFTDTPTRGDKFQYRLKQIDFDGKFEYSNIIDVELESPAKFSVQQNYPNPFNPATTIRYELSQNSYVTIKIFDSLSRELKSLVNANQESGLHQVNFDASGYPSGIYYYTIKAGTFSQTKKMLLIK